MIDITCPKCAKVFRVSREHIGKRGTCKACGEKFAIQEPVKPTQQPAVKKTAPLSESVPKAPINAVGEAQPKKLVISFDAPALAKPATPGAPTSGAVTQTSQAPANMSPRMRRLWFDAETIRLRFEGFPLIRVAEMRGNPPDYYRIEYRVRGLQYASGNQMQHRDSHMVEIQLTHDYPRQQPKCKMLTPIFHPNIDPAAICIGDHWSAQEKLADLIVRIGELIAYQDHNIKSPLNGEAAMWTDLNCHRLPIDARCLMPGE